VLARVLRKEPHALLVGRYFGTDTVEVVHGGGVVAELGPTRETVWTVACQAPLSTEFPRQGYWSRLLFPSPGDLPDPGIKSESPVHFSIGLFVFYVGLYCEFFVYFGY